MWLDYQRVSFKKIDQGATAEGPLSKNSLFLKRILWRSADEDRSRLGKGKSCTFIFFGMLARPCGRLAISGPVAARSCRRKATIVNGKITLEAK